MPAVMYGMIPRPKIVECCRLPPENVATYCEIFAHALPSVDSNAFRRVSWFTPGIGTQCPMRKTTSIPSVNRSLSRSSLTWNTLISVLSIESESFSRPPMTKSEQTTPPPTDRAARMIGPAPSTLGPSRESRPIRSQPL